MSKQLAKLFASRFIARPDVKAIQLHRDAGNLKQGDWFPDTKVDAVKRPNSPHLPAGFNMEHLVAHIEGRRTYGHYLLNPDNMCKLFAFDIDLTDGKVDEDDLVGGTYARFPDFRGDENDDEVEAILNDTVVYNVNPRELWQTRKRSAAEARAWYKYQLKHAAHLFASKVREIGIPCAVAYSGSKGVHVYGFTGPKIASEVREAGLMVLEMTNSFESYKGKNFFRAKSDHPIHGFGNLTVELFPKQVDISEKSLGNLMRLPLGINYKNPADPTFFLDMTTPLSEFTPIADPTRLLETGDCFA